MFCSEVFAAFSSGGISKINRHVAMVVNMSGCFFLFLTHSVGLNPYTLLSLIICVMAATFNRNFFLPAIYRPFAGVLIQCDAYFVIRSIILQRLIYCRLFRYSVDVGDA